MLTRFVEVWLLPPGILIVALAVAGALLLRQSARERRSSPQAGSAPALVRLARRVGLALVVLTGVLYLLSIPLVSRSLIGSLERRVSTPAAEALVKARAVVVLGGGLTVVDPEVPAMTVFPGTDTEMSAALPPEALARLIEGVLVADSLGLPLIVSGGRVFAESVVPPEARVAAYLARRVSGPDLEIVTETASRSTAENAMRVAELVGDEPVALVTSAYHLPRAVRSFERAGMTVYPVAAAFRSDRRPFHPVMLLPSAGALDDSAIWMRELMGLLWYSIRGR